MMFGYQLATVLLSLRARVTLYPVGAATTTATPV